METANSLCETTTLIPLILERLKSGLTKFQLNKIASYITIRFGTKEQKDKVILYSFGTHLMNLESTIHYLENNNLIKTDKNKYVITECGLSWIAEKILQLEEGNASNKSIFDKMVSQIDISLFTDIPTLIKKTLSSDAKWDFKQREVSGNNLYLIFEWSKYGTGMLLPYMYTLLYSYSKVEKYFENKWKDNKLDIDPIEYSRIPEHMSSTLLTRTRKLKNVPLTSIFEKALPPYLTEEKIEGKNYISNLWYIVEGVNILHALAGIAPTVSDISMLCLTNYQHGVLNKDIDEDMLKKMRESIIRNDINKLNDYGILLKDKYNRKYRYTLSALSFCDTILDRKFSVVDKPILKSIYETKIKIYSKDRFE
nr:MAG: hypothetical protein OI716_00745 [Candidatus Methanoperedens sp.]WAI00076.1 MAG: hypothetical protein OI720_00590 [Candidatus Methanoperedens sp.]